MHRFSISLILISFVAIACSNSSAAPSPLGCGPATPWGVSPSPGDACSPEGLECQPEDGFGCDFICKGGKLETEPETSGHCAPDPQIDPNARRDASVEADAGADAQADIGDSAPD